MSGPLITACLNSWTFHGVTGCGKVSFLANTSGIPISHVLIQGSGEITERAAKFTLFPIIFFLKSPSFFSKIYNMMRARDGGKIKKTKLLNIFETHVAN